MEKLGTGDSYEMHDGIDPWDIPEDEDGDDSWDFQIEDVSVQSKTSEKPSISVAAVSIKTAACLSREQEGTVEDDSTPSVPRVSPDAFKQGMTVTHPEYGPGKIVALSGSGKNRRATIQFATVGEKKIILAHSTVRPAR